MSSGLRAAAARLFAFAFLLALWVPPAAVSAAATASAGLYLTTLPAGADVWVDGNYVGRSPVFIDALAEGRHHLTLTKTGWSVAESDVDVSAIALTLRSLQLMPAARQKPGIGAASFHGLPPGASLEIDGRPATVGPGKPVTLAAGAHQLALATPGGQVVRSFAVYPDTTTEVLLRPLAAGAEVSPIIAAAVDYIPAEAFTVEGRKVVIRYEGHLVVGKLEEAALRFDGKAVAFAGTPTLIGGKLYLPLPLLERLTGGAGESSK
jgi:hypothetical protein